MLRMFIDFRTNKILWNITTLLTFVAASAGILFPRMYDNVFAKEFIPGALPQDILTVMICVGLFILISKTKESDIKKQIIILGIIGSFFYLYGIFTIERVYNYFYILYAAIFAFSFWSILFSLMHLHELAHYKVSISSVITKISAISGLAIAILFSILWILSLLPLMKTHNRIEYHYSIYILDLCFVMPAFFICAILTLQKKSIGLLLLPSVLIIGFFVIFPLGLGELAKPFYGQIPNANSMIMSFVFSAYMLVVGGLHVWKLKIVYNKKVL